jgi:hypothetical protein
MTGMWYAPRALFLCEDGSTCWYEVPCDEPEHSTGCCHNASVTQGTPFPILFSNPEVPPCPHAATSGS